MKIAVTGGAGFLGRYVCACLTEHRAADVVSLGRSETSNGDIETRITDYSPASLEKVLADIDAVVHLAAKRGGSGHIAEFEENIRLTQNLYETCKRLSIKNIVYASSISVYSAATEQPWTETQIPQPQNVYGISKLAGELLGDMYNREAGLQIKHLRFAHLFGLNEQNDYMLNKFMRLAYNKKPLTVFGKSNTPREYLYAKDAAKAVAAALQQEEQTGAFNIGSEETLTNLEVAQLVNHAFRNDGNLRWENPDAADGIPATEMSSHRAREVLGYTPDYEFATALAGIYELMKQQATSK